VATATSATTGTAPLTVSFTSENSSDPENAIASRSWSFGNGETATGMTASTTYDSPGTYSAVLSVVDSGNLSDTDAVVVTVNAPPLPPNVLPTAAAAADKTSGMAPLTVSFSSAGSIDPDGTISSYSWNFGDGSPLSNAQNPSKTYTVPGNYSARLTVTDNRGGSTTSAPIAISATANPGMNVDISQISLVANNAKSGATGQATISVRDSTSAVAGVSVTVQWTGVVSGSSTGTTNSSGMVILASPKTKKSGDVTVTVTNVTPPAGRAYDPMMSEPKGTPVLATVKLN
jgi:PKD repeat protein